ncbi:hypothetical protein GPX89_40030 [Nocardia sp. ET3-3]|uniref:Uncharacterized protein n=1 Tax=Nocardia terrae TaxID=2675851 RepID=A0A7K1V9U1_9NOCA|nr:hypothetical protein [Nocardia terrae]MVU83414.1 hypothetical protein [Nocardia terrae]
MRQNDTNPIDQVRENTFNIKNLAKQFDLDLFVSGMVLVMPALGPRPTLEKKDLPVGIDVLLGSEPDLRQWFTTNARHKPIWTAEQAHTLITALNFARSVTISTLIDQGFPPETAAPTPRTPIPAGPIEGPITTSPRHTPDPDTTPSTVSVPWPPPRRTHGWQPLRLIAAAALWLAIAAGAGAALTPDHAPSYRPPTTSAETAAPERQPPAEPTAPSSGPPQSTPPPCFPLQPAC